MLALSVLIVIQFYLKLTLSSFLMIVILINIIKTIKGVSRGETTLTPATVVIYLTFLGASMLAVVLTIFNKVINDKYENDPSANQKKLEKYDFYLLEMYETFYWAAQLAFVHKYIVTAFEMPQFFTYYQIKLEGNNMVGAAQSLDEAAFEKKDAQHKVLTDKTSSDWKMWLSLLFCYTGYVALEFSNIFILKRVTNLPFFKTSTR